MRGSQQNAADTNIKAAWWISTGNIHSIHRHGSQYLEEETKAIVFGTIALAVVVVAIMVTSVLNENRQ